MRKTILWFLGATLCLTQLAVPTPCFADEIVLKNGGLIRGKILEENDAEVVIRLADGNKLRLARRQIKELRKTKDTGDGSAKPKPQTGSGAMTLRWGLKVGEVLSYRSRTTRKFSTRAVAGRESSNEKVEKTTIEMTLEVISVSQKDYVLELTIDSFKKRVVKGEANKAPDDDQDFIGKPMRVRMSKRGEILEVISFGPARISDMPQQQQRKVEQFVGEYCMRQTVFSLLGTLPKDRAKPGETSWDEAATAPVPHLGDMTFRVTNRMRWNRAGTAVIAQTGKITTTGIKRRQLKSSKVSGEVRFTDRLKGADQTVTMRVQLGAEAGNVIFDLHQKTRLELLSSK